jgi:hypothetical protein
MGKLRRLALASREVCSYIGRVAIQFSMRLCNSALNNRMCLWGAICSVEYAPSQPGSDRAIHPIHAKALSTAAD